VPLKDPKFRCAKCGSSRKCRDDGQDNEAAARAYAEAAMAQSPDLRVVDIHARPCDSTEPPAGRQRAAWLRRRKQPALEQNPTG